MKITWTFYPRHEASISLTLIYEPKLDAHTLKSGGYLNEENNTALVDWNTYKIFDSLDVKAKKDAYRRLIRIKAKIDNKLELYLNSM